jgi:hypothetical protein
VTEPVGALTLKGLIQPVAAYNVPLAAGQPILRVVDGRPPNNRFFVATHSGLTFPQLKDIGPPATITGTRVCDGSTTAGVIAPDR